MSKFGLSEWYVWVVPVTLSHLLSSRVASKRWSTSNVPVPQVAKSVFGSPLGPVIFRHWPFLAYWAALPGSGVAEAALVGDGLRDGDGDGLAEALADALASVPPAVFFFFPLPMAKIAMAPPIRSTTSTATMAMTGPALFFGGGAAGAPHGAGCPYPG